MNNFVRKEYLYFQAKWILHFLNIHVLEFANSSIIFLLDSDVMRIMNTIMDEIKDKKFKDVGKEGSK